MEGEIGNVFPLIFCRPCFERAKPPVVNALSAASFLLQVSLAGKPNKGKWEAVRMRKVRR